MRRSSRVLPAFLLTLLASSALFSQSSETSPSVSLPGSQSPYLGSSPEGTATSEILQIDFKEAIERGLRNNLGLLLASDQSLAARGQRWQQLSELLPNVSIRALEDAQTTSLTALGFRGKLFPVPVPRVIGPFNYFDLRASLSQNVFDYR